MMNNYKLSSSQRNTAKVVVVLFMLFMGFGNSLKAQLTGTKSIPGDYATIELAVADLNTLGVGAGGVVFNVAAGHTETATAVISLTTVSSLTNSITFQKSGVGANPVITAYTGGTGTPASAVQDGIFRFVGSDYVTIDGIDLMENAANIANPATMEYGYGFYKASVTDGCQNNTIKNCTITLNRINNAAGSAPAVEGSKGIEFTNAIPTAATTALTITSSAGSNSGNKIYSNTIQNCNYGIVVIGYVDTTPFLNADQNNDIGGVSIATGNTIINYGGGAATSPAAGIRTLAQYGLNVSYNTINNNNGSGVNHATTLRGIFINTATSANATIASNTVTVNSAATTSALTAIENTSGSTAASNTININNNTVQNCTYATATSGAFTGILNSSTAAIVNINNNILTNNIIPGTGQMDLINCSSPPSLNVIGNSITLNSKTGATTGNVFSAIRMTSPTNAIFSGNTIENNSITSATSTGIMAGIYGINSGVNITANSNIIRNLSHSGTGSIVGIREFGVGGNKNIQNNQVYNFTTANGASLTGISVGAGTVTVNGNRVYSLNSTGGTGGTNVGILGTGGTALNVFNNKVYDISAGNSTSSVFGIQMSGGTTQTIYNNLVGDLRTPLASATNSLIGVNITGGTTSNIYFNTVMLNGISSGANFGSSAVSVSTTPTVNLRNNIFVNTSTPAGTGLTVAYRRSTTTLTSYANTSNNNLFYAGTPGAANLIFSDGTSSDQTLAAYKTRVGTTRDASSVTENVVWQSTLGSDLNFLNVDLVSPTQIESAAQPIGTPAIIDDYDGNIRNSTTPDMGAWEGAYTPNDLNAPSITAVSLVGNACDLSTRSLTAVIADPSNVASGALAPRCYYKVGAGAYTSVQGTLTSGTVASGTWTFNLNYTAIVGDVISYYVIAQDASMNNNITSNPSAGLVATDVNTVTSDPTTPLSWTVAGFLSGTYTVGAGGNYTTLTAAANAYNTNCLAGPVIFSLTDATYSAGETFPIVFMNNVDASSVNTLTIMPATGVASVITGTGAAAAVVKFLNARYISIDGVNSGGSSLTITNTNTGASAVVWMASTATSGPGNNNITVKNATLNGGSITGTNNYGINASVDGATPSTTGGLDNDNITIQANTILKCYYGVFGAGTAAVSAGGLNSWSITNNLIGPVTAGTDNIGFSGINMNNALGAVITGNTVRNIVSTAASSASISLSSNVDGVTLSQNTINGLTNSSTGGTLTSATGIFLGPNVINASVFKNQLTNLVNTNTGGYAVRGIMVNTTNATSNVSIYNNMISDVYSYSDAAANWWPMGIAIMGTSGGINVDFNTVHMFGSHVGFSAASGSAAFYTTSTGGNIKVRNNIFVNTFDNSTVGTDIAYSIYSAQPASNFSAIDNNNYYVGGTGNVPVLGFLTANQLTLAAIQASFGGNLGSKNVNPVFTSNTDLHLPANSNVPLNNFGAPIAGITMDIDDEARDVATPDMGADEFVPTVCVSSDGGTSLVSTDTVCAGQTITLTNTGATSGSGITYQWQVSTVSGGPYTDVTGGAGATTTTYTTGALTAGTYYYVLKVECSSGPSTGYSTQDTVVVHANPVVSVTPNTGSICLPGGSPITLTASGTLSYSWAPIAGLTPSTGDIVSANPPSTTNYTVTGTDANGCVGTAIASITVSANPTISSATATPANICSGANSQLDVSASVSSSILITEVTVFRTGTGATTPYPGYAVGQDLVELSNISTSPVDISGFVLSAFGDNSATASHTITFPVGTVIPANGVAVVCLGTGTTDLVNRYFPTGGTSDSYFSTGKVGVVLYNGTMVVDAVGLGGSVTGSYTFAAGTGVSAASFTGFAPNASGLAGVIRTAASDNNAGSDWSSSSAILLQSIGTYNGGYSLPSTLSYLWTPSTFLSDPAISNPVANGVTATTSYTVQVSSSNGCSSVSNPVTITVAPLSGVTFTATPNDTVCVGTAVTITAIPEGGGAPYLYSWSPVVAATNTISVTPSATSTYTVQVDDNCGASTTATVQIVVNDLPLVTATPSTGTYCNPGPAVALTASGASSYTWLPVTGLDVTNSATPNASPLQSTTYTVTGTDANGCVATANVFITSGNSPTISSITATPSAICAGDSSQLNAGAFIPTLVNSLPFTSGTGASLNPMVGATQVLASGNDDDVTASPAAIGFTFNFNGVNYTQYSASPDGWIVLGNAAATNDFTNGVADATNIPKIYPYWDDIATGTDGNVQTLVTGTAPNRIFIVQWFVTVPRATAGPANSTFQAWLYETSNKVEFRYGTMGAGAMSASVGLTGAATNFNCVTVSTNTNSTSAVNNTNAGQPVSGTIYSWTPATLTYSWTPATFLNNTSIANPMAMAATTTTDYTLTATSSIGCATTSNVTLTVNQLPSVNLGNDTSVCYVGTIVPLTLDAANPTAGFVWNTAETTQTIAASNSGTYDVVVTDVNGCVAKDTIAIVYNAAPTVNLGNDTTLCGGSLTLDAANVGNTVLWNDASTNQTYIASITGQVDVTVTTPQGCSDQDTIMVTVNPLPVVDLGIDTLVCGTSLTLDASNAGSTYVWNTVETTQTINITNSGQFFVTVTNVQNCSAKDTINVTIAPAVMVNLGNDSAVCLTTSIILDAQNSGSNYLWNDNSTSSSLVVTSPGTYYVTVTSPSGCVANDTIVFADNSPVVTLSLPFSITCVNTTVNTLSGGTPSGGNYSGSGVFGTNFDASIPGAGTTVISYTYVDVVTGCDATANQSVTVDPCIGINEVSAVAAVSVVPNPNNGYFSILTSSRESVVKAELYSADGKLIFSDVLKGSGKYDVNISEYANGIYYLRLSVDGVGSVVKVAKQY